MAHVLDHLEDFTNDWINWLQETDEDHTRQDLPEYTGPRCPFAKKAWDDSSPVDRPAAEAYLESIAMWRHYAPSILRGCPRDEQGHARPLTMAILNARLLKLQNLDFQQHYHNEPH